MNHHARYWARLDNAALIFPASKRKGWFNRYRISVTLNEPVEPQVLQEAFEALRPRYPLIVARLRRGFFWYYLEELEKAPQVLEDGFQPMMQRRFRSVRESAVNVFYYENRIAVEFFHAVTDGGGGQIFVRNLLAEYLERRHGISIPLEKGIVDRKSGPAPGELEDSHSRYRGEVALDRKEGKAWKLDDPKEPDGFLHLTTAELSAGALYEKAKERGTTITVYLTAVLLEALLELQKERVPKRRRRRAVRVQIPVNLRKLFPSVTMRNFVYVINTGVDPRMGDYTFEELIEIVKHQFALFITPKNMQGLITTNVNSEHMPIIRVIPLFLKNIVMRAVFDMIGETQACLGISNLGRLELPDCMVPYVSHFDFIIGPQASSPHNCAVCSFGDCLRINFVRNSISPELERRFFTGLVRRSLHVRIESNDRSSAEDAPREAKRK